MEKLKNTKTEKNLHEAFAGESMARNKYTYFAGKAKKEGFEQIAEFFQETADNEKEHAKIWFKILNGGDLSSTTDNLKSSAEGENFEHTVMYARMAKEAREEGFNDIAVLFEQVAKIEAHHEARYLNLMKNINDNAVFTRTEKQTWHCRNCGFIFENAKAPTLCPVCKHPQSFFEILSTNF